MTLMKSKKKEKNRELRNYLRRVEVQFIGRQSQKCEIIKEHWNDERSRWVFLLKVEEKGYAVQVRFQDGHVNSINKPYPTLDEAEKQFQIANEVKTKVQLQLIDNYYITAKKFIRKYKEHEERGDLGKADFSLFTDLKKIQFIIAVSELHEFGFEILGENKKVEFKLKGSKSGKDKDFFDGRRRINRNLVRKIDNYDFDTGLSSLRPKLLKTLDAITSEAIFSESYVFGLYSRMIVSAKTVFQGYHKAYGDFPDEDAIYALFEEYRDQNIISGVNPNGRIERQNPHPMIPIDELNKILDLGFEMSAGLFNFLILSLSTTLRPSEIRRLVENKERLILNGEELDYKTGRIIQKTTGKWDPSELTNPALSIISRVILNYNHPIAPKNIVVEFFAAQGEMRGEVELEGFYERALRTTAGHMLGFCIKAQYPHTSNIYLIKERMGHRTIKQAMKTYAKNLPHNRKSPEGYFGNAGVKKDGVLLTAHQPLWDSYLLSKWIEKMNECLPVDQMRIIWNQIKEEQRMFIADVAPDESIFKPKEY